MKRCVILVLAALLLLSLTACDSAPAPVPAVPMEPLDPVTLDVPEETEPEVKEEYAGSADPAETYTVEQLQAALQVQFMVGNWGEGNPQVIAAQRVERDRDYIRLEGAGPDAPPIDLTNSARYRVEIRFRQSLEEYAAWADMFLCIETNPFRRDGDYTILTEYYYFNDVNGVPELAFVSC